MYDCLHSPNVSIRLKIFAFIFQAAQLSYEAAHGEEQPYSHNKALLLKQYKLWNTKDVRQMDLPPLPTADCLPTTGMCDSEKKGLSVLTFFQRGVTGRWYSHMLFRCPNSCLLQVSYSRIRQNCQTIDTCFSLVTA